MNHLSPAASRTGATPNDVRMNTHVYKRASGAALELRTLYLPAPSPRPGILFFFGGGWRDGNLEQFMPHARHFAAGGMIAAVAEYRVERRHGVTPFECVADGKSAVRWLRCHAEELGLEPNRLAVGGGSAGGHVALCTTLLDGFGEPGEDGHADANALVLFNPVLDTTEAGYGYERLGERAADLSPTHHVRPGLPPTLIFHGTHDRTVPFENAERFTKLMRAVGNRCELVPFEGAGHGFFNADREGKEMFRSTLRHTDAFLASSGFTPGGAFR